MKVIQHYPKAQGRFGGTGTVPSVTMCFASLSKNQGFLVEDKIGKNQKSVIISFKGKSCTIATEGCHERAGTRIS